MGQIMSLNGKRPNFLQSKNSSDFVLHIVPARAYEDQP